MPIKLVAKHDFKIPINAECISPDILAGKSNSEIASLKVWEGNKQTNLGKLFNIEGETGKTPAETCIEIVGNLHKVRRIGAKMTSGEILVKGNAGMHLGEEMKGGTIKVYGDADSWCGAMMKGGTIEITGNVGDFLGATYRGAITKAMNGGTIIVHGNAGNEIGYYMKNGTIKIEGNAGQFVGIHMQNGTILIKGKCEERVGACMTSGKIVLLGYVESILPSFTLDSIKPKTKVEDENVEGPFYLFIGDLTEKGDGKVFVSCVKNPHLNFYEKLL
jgi:formylmethanofuran dehydrogenase subunit C